MDTLHADTLRIIYDMLPPIYRIQFARVCKALYTVASPGRRDITQIVNDRLKYPYMKEVFRYGGYIGGEAIYDCLYDTSYSSTLEVLFDIGVQYPYKFHDTPRVWPCNDGKVTLFIKFMEKMATGRQKVMAGAEVGVYTSSRMSNTGFKYRPYNIDDKYTLDIIITDPGIHNYFAACGANYRKVLYDGTQLIAPYSLELIRKHSITFDRGPTDQYRTENEYGKPISPSMPDVTYIDRFVNKATWQGFTIDVIPSIR